MDIGKLIDASPERVIISDSSVHYILYSLGLCFLRKFFMSSGNGASIVKFLPEYGCLNSILEACNAHLLNLSLKSLPKANFRSPTRGCFINLKCILIWFLLPVTGWISRIEKFLSIFFVLYFVMAVFPFIFEDIVPLFFCGIP